MYEGMLHLDHPILCLLSLVLNLPVAMPSEAERVMYKLWRS